MLEALSGGDFYPHVMIVVHCLSNKCLDCHYKDNYCSVLEANKGPLGTTLKEVIDNQAVLRDDECLQLIPCLKNPSADVSVS